MKKKLLTLTLLSCLSITALGQSTIPNMGFENWIDMTTYEDPENWVTFNMFSGFGYPVTTNKTTDANSGSFAAKLETLSNGTDTLLGYLTAGTGDFFNGVNNNPFNVRPARMKFYYKGGPVANDTCVITVVLTRWDTDSNAQVTLGGGALFITSIQNSYTLTELNFEYDSTSIANPDSIMVTAMSSAQFPGLPGSVLYLDDISFEMAGVGIYETDTYVSSIYPNPVKEELSIRLHGTTATSIEILDIAGRLVDEIELKETNTLNVSHLNSGAYLYNLKNKGVIVSKGKFNVTK